jgi:ADP-L-glycero-D-manno-heptose 6-epimerase
MKILLTGHKGFIGSNMLNALQEVCEVDTYDYDDGQRPGVMGYDWVIHIGGISSTTEKDIDKILRQNYEFSVDLFEECKTFGVNLQYSSSASVYGLNKEFSENSPVDPRTPYAWSKYLFERYVNQHQGGNIVQGFRYFNVYGIGEDHKGNQASPFTQFKKQAMLTGKIKLFENSEKYHRDFIHVNDVVNYHLKFLQCDKSGIFNIGTGKTLSFADVAKSVSETYGAGIITIPMPENLKASYQEYTCADMRKTNEALK